jgi:hypothetical protein
MQYRKQYLQIRTLVLKHLTDIELIACLISWAMRRIRDFLACTRLIWKVAPNIITSTFTGSFPSRIQLQKPLLSCIWTVVPDLRAWTPFSQKTVLWELTKLILQTMIPSKLSTVPICPGRQLVIFYSLTCQLELVGHTEREPLSLWTKLDRISSHFCSISTKNTLNIRQEKSCWLARVSEESTWAICQKLS